VAQLGIVPLSLPSSSPALNLIERPCKVTKRRALYDRYHLTCRDFQAAIPEVLDALPSKFWAKEPTPFILSTDARVSTIYRPGCPMRHDRSGNKVEHTQLKGEIEVRDGEEN
jgi:hypothetical protein